MADVGRAKGRREASEIRRKVVGKERSGQENKRGVAREPRRKRLREKAGREPSIIKRNDTNN
ncbi:hypothetical protein Q73_05285 [Bacillus coahuilensis m2-6]|uniref:Uncharacterized protein n=1 Tax=Bacillus coahuilensis p1.1.43 TaxID=1150625 RepID=A0A147K9C7_9BACI|nr:hypothetical protein Q75_05825 [Bacillus coahuilensis p1.1.43]KUP08605.1 hypothetical protein Q73_05285 [Bacillus coahuilensis m2-6]